MEPDIQNTLSAVLEAWSLFDIDAQKSHLKNVTTQSQTAKDKSLNARKLLTELTKKFKRSVKIAETLLAEVGDGNSEMKGAIETLTKESKTIVKSYREEIDSLTRRCKASDSAISGLYQNMNELPDPSPVIRSIFQLILDRDAEIKETLEDKENMKSHNTDLERQLNEARELIKQIREEKLNEQAQSNQSSGKEREELISLRKEVAEYEEEFRGLKNQDITIRKLEAKIQKLQNETQEEMANELEKVKSQIAETEGRRAADALEREAAIERKLQSVELELRAERAGRRALETNFLNASEGEVEREAAWEAQRKILVDDTERLRENLHEAQKERDDLRLKLGVLGSDAENEPNTTLDEGCAVGMQDMIAERKAYEAEVCELSTTVSRLREELKANEDKMNEEKEKFKICVDTLKEEKSVMTKMLSDLNTKLANVPSQTAFDNMKRELRILRRLEYNAEDLEVESMREPEMTTEDCNNDLESVLVARLRKVDDDLIREKREKNDIEKKCESLSKKIELLETDKTKSEKLIATLEADLNKAIATSTAKCNTNCEEGNLSLNNTLKSNYDVSGSPQKSNLLTEKVGSTHSSMIKRSDRRSSKNIQVDPSNDDNSVATIIMAQRNRLQSRCDALESERNAFKGELQVQFRELENLKRDNTKLYEKVRYLQSFANKKSSGFVNNASEMDFEALEENYEASVDPFRQFGRAERARKIREMPPLERIVFLTAKFVLASKEMRTALFFYVSMMHLLVFITTYHWAHGGSCSDLELHPSLGHMHGGPPVEDGRS